MSVKKIVITGGHITPALAMIDLLKKNQWEIFYLGRKHAMQGDKELSLEARMIPDLGVTFISFSVGRFSRRLTWVNFWSVMKLPISIVQAGWYLKKIKPNIVVSFGGYLGLPVIIAGWALRIPSLIHEQVSVAGLANRLSQRLANQVAISFPGSRKYYQDQKVKLTGNPLQPGVFKVLKTVRKKYTGRFHHPVTILIFGGNQGAKVINKVVLNTIDKLVDKYNVIHQIGSVESQDAEWEQALAWKRQADKHKSDNYYPVRFIAYEEMGTVYNLADLVVCRSGANTVTELAVLGKPALLIPLEPTSMDEQLNNARLLVKSGLGEILRQKDLAPASFLTLIDKMVQRNDQYRLMPEFKDQFVTQGARNLYRLICQVANLRL